MLAVVALAAAHLVPAERVDLPSEQLPEQTAALRAGLQPFDYQHAEMDRWFALWRDSVQGTGRAYEWLDLTLDGIFAVLFIAFLFWVSRQKHSAPGA